VQTLFVEIFLHFNRNSRCSVKDAWS